MSGHGQTSKINPQKVRKQGRASQREGIRPGEEGLAVPSAESGCESERISRVVGTGRDPSLPRDVAGKIVDELIEAQEKRAQEAQECIDWYTREREFAIKKAEELKGLREQITIEDEAEPSESEESGQQSE